MNKKVNLSVFFFLCLFIASAQSQADREKAKEKGKKAIELEDQGKYAEALSLLDEAEKLVPDDYNYPYEKGYAYYAQGDFKKALVEFGKTITYKGATDQCYQMLGNTYDMMGDSINAFKSYNDGLHLFPKSGKLFLEKGNVYWTKKQFGKALYQYEEGIKADPKFSSNYYRACRLYCNSTEEVWGMIYGEIFMNLESGSKRTEEISKLLYNTYKKEIKFTSDNSYSVSFSKNATLSVDDGQDLNNLKLPFGLGAYEPTLMLALINEKTIDLNSLDRIRRRFVDIYFERGNNKKYPNVLFDFQQTIIKAGQMEAYNHWLLMKGNEEDFGKWQKENREKWDSFVDWFKANDIPIDENHYFHSEQYSGK